MLHILSLLKASQEILQPIEIRWRDINKPCSGSDNLPSPFPSEYPAKPLGLMSIFYLILARMEEIVPILNVDQSPFSLPAETQSPFTGTDSTTLPEEQAGLTIFNR
jgi:hypothetical protein